MEQEEYDYKLSRNNPVLVAKVISNIITFIKNKLDSNTKYNCFELAEFKYLKQKCLSGDTTISCAAGNGLVHLTRCRLVEVSKMMSDVTAMIPFAQNHRGLLIVVTELLVMDMETKLQSGNYNCPFNLAIPQHPFISILVHNSNSWNIVLNHIRKLYQADDKRFREALNELLRPLYLYILCDPYMKISELCRVSFLNFLLEENCVPLIADIVGWLQISSIENQIYSNSVLITLLHSECIKHDDELQEFILFWLISFLHELCSTKSDPTETIIALSKQLKLQFHRNVDIIILFLAKCIIVVPPTYLMDLLKICIQILPDNLHILTALVLQASLVNWMLYPSEILEGCSTLLSKLYSRVKNLSTSETININFDNCYMNLLQNTNQHLHLIVQVYQLFVDKSSLHKNMLLFLNSANNFSPFLVKHTILFTSGIFIYETDQQNITLQAISLLLRHASNYNHASNNILTLLLYKLANCYHSNVQFEILKGIVQMGKCKENVHVVIATLKALGDTSPQMKTTILTLYFELWKLEPKCYFLLQKMLFEENRLDRNNFALTKAHIIRELCKLKAELYGSELAIYISKIMNSCKADNGMATSFVLEGLTYLCTKGIIDITTAWDTLEPSFRAETRSNVIVSFCNLLAELQSLYTETAKFDKMMHDVIIKLWDYVLNNSDTKVVEAAYKALATFNIEHISEQFLEVYQSRHINDTNYWFMTLLHNNSYTNLDSTVNFIISCLSKEIAEYGRGIYYVLESKAEPTNYEYLPSRSILRGLMAHIKRNYSTRSRVEMACFKILSQQYPKPLPPLDWCFLQEFIHDVNFRQYCIAIASRQVILSGTARRFIENLIVAITENPNKDDFWCVMNNMKYICNSIQPVIIKPFLIIVLNYALNTSEADDNSLLDFVICKVRELMQKDDFQDVNKSVLAEILVGKTEDMPLTSSGFHKLMECVSILPYTYIKPLITPKLWVNVTSDKLRQSIILCGHLVKITNESPMAYYNEIINTIGDELLDAEYFLSYLCNITHDLKDHYSLPNWFLELLGQAQLELIDSNNFSPRASFMCDILIVTIVSISNQQFFLKTTKAIDMARMVHLLPQAFVFVLREEKWNKYTTQVIEWVYYMINYEMTPIMYRRAFYQSLVALRHEPEFKGSLKWLKYIGCRITDDDN